jgi:hypothetical protein
MIAFRLRFYHPKFYNSFMVIPHPSQVFQIKGIYFQPSHFHMRVFLTNIMTKTSTRGTNLSGIPVIPCHLKCFKLVKSSNEHSQISGTLFSQIVAAAKTAVAASASAVSNIFFRSDS